MIKIIIETNGKKVYDSFDEENLTLVEVALVIMRLEEIKKDLLSREFKSEFEIKSGKFAEE